MSYKLNKTDGSLLIDLIDGQIDQDSTNLVLVGRNYTGFGEFINENFVKLLENFSNTAAPSNPITGQLWWDTSEQRLKIYDGTVWKASGGPFVQDTRPQMVAGDLWINQLDNKFYFYDGTDLVLVGPLYTAQQGESGFRVEDIIDENGRPRTTVKMFVGGSLVGVFSNIEFTPVYSERILGLVSDSNPDGVIKKGFNVIDDAEFKYHGIATGANALITDTGAIRDANSFLPADSNGTTVGTLTIQNSGGLTIGLAQNNIQKVVADRFYVENQLLDHDLSFRVRSSAAGALIVDGIYVKAATQQVGIFTNNPIYTLDVNGDARVAGNLYVDGDTTFINSTNLVVEDKNIELGVIDGSTIGSDAVIDGGGISLRSTNGDKEIYYSNPNQSWTVNTNFDLENNKVYKIDGAEVLSQTALGPGIATAFGLNRIGTLDELQVDQLFLDGQTIRNVSAGLTLDLSGALNFSSPQQIKTVATPTDPQDATNKDYVDEQINSERLTVTLDITGLNDSQIAEIIEQLYPASEKEIGAEAIVLTQSLTGATVTGIQVTVSQMPDTSGVIVKSLATVDANGTLNTSVVADIAQGQDAQGTVVVTIARGRKRFFVNNSNAWEFDQDLTLTIT